MKVENELAEAKRQLEHIHGYVADCCKILGVDAAERPADAWTLREACLEMVRANRDARAAAEQAKEAVRSAGKDPRWAAIWAWCDAHKDEAVKIISDASGEVERELMAERAAHEKTKQLLNLSRETCEVVKQDHDAAVAKLGRAIAALRDAEHVVSALVEFAGAISDGETPNTLRVGRELLVNIAAIVADVSCPNCNRPLAEGRHGYLVCYFGG